MYERVNQGRENQQFCKLCWKIYIYEMIAAVK